MNFAVSGQKDVQEKFDKLRTDLLLSLTKSLISLGNFEDAVEKVSEVVHVKQV